MPRPPKTSKTNINPRPDGTGMWCEDMEHPGCRIYRPAFAPEDRFTGDQLTREALSDETHGLAAFDRDFNVDEFVAGKELSEFYPDPCEQVAFTIQHVDSTLRDFYTALGTQRPMFSYWIYNRCKDLMDEELQTILLNNINQDPVYVKYLEAALLDDEA